MTLLRLTLLRLTLGALSLSATAATALSLVKHPHWVFRLWDFPRVQVATAAGLSTIAYGALCLRRKRVDGAIVALGVLSTSWQLYKIRPYTRLARKQVKAVKTSDRRVEAGQRTLSLLVSNVLMENEQHDKLLATVNEHDPDLVLALEVNARWMEALAPLSETHPYVVRHPLENYYGMVLFSRYELVDPQVRFLVQDDIPSIHTGVRLPSGEVVHLHGLHPRPPEPIRDQPSAPRDAELVLMGRRIGDAEARPTIVAGDLNDVAWSRSSELFLRLSGLLDPRVGRGFYNSYNAQNPVMRYPLDHVFHSHDFRLVSLRRLPSIGSDHFPILITLLYEPAAVAGQPENQEQPGDRQEAVRVMNVEAEAAATGADRPNDD